ncbi:MAG: hypothetical protein P9L88_01115 [Candidatus Tantalella remota]|nr:hypothetical protein [Candidatus Tantalella remota]
MFDLWDKHRNLVKVTVTLVVCLFLLNTSGVAQEEVQYLINSKNSIVDTDDLSPELRLTQDAFRERYLASATTLAHRATNDYIHKQIPKDGLASLKTRGDFVWVNDKDKQTITIVSIPDLLRNTGQFAHVGLGRKNGMPVIYVDDDYFYNEAVVEHDKDEISKWETKRRELGKDYEGMREWIRGSDEAKKLAEEYHASSRDLGELYGDVRENYRDLLDWDNIYAAYLAFGLDEDDKDVNIAAKKGKTKRARSERRQKEREERKLAEKKARTKASDQKKKIKKSPEARKVSFYRKVSAVIWLGMVVFAVVIVFKIVDVKKKEAMVTQWRENARVTQSMEALHHLNEDEEAFVQKIVEVSKDSDPRDLKASAEVFQKLLQFAVGKNIRDPELLYRKASGRRVLREMLQGPGPLKEVGGHRTFPYGDLVYVSMGEWAVTDHLDKGFKLATSALATCKGVVLYDPDTKTGALCHNDLDWILSDTIDAMFTKMGTPSNVKVWVTDNVTLEDRKAIAAVLGSDSYDFAPLPKAFLFNTRTGKVECFENSKDMLNGGQRVLSDLKKRIDLHKTRTALMIEKCFMRYDRGNPQKQVREGVDGYADGRIAGIPAEDFKEIRAVGDKRIRRFRKQFMDNFIFDPVDDNQGIVFLRAPEGFRYRWSYHPGYARTIILRDDATEGDIANAMQGILADSFWLIGIPIEEYTGFIGQSKMDRGEYASRGGRTAFGDGEFSEERKVFILGQEHLDPYMVHLFGKLIWEDKDGLESGPDSWKNREWRGSLDMILGHEDIHPYLEVYRNDVKSIERLVRDKGNRVTALGSENSGKYVAWLEKRAKKDELKELEGILRKRGVKDFRSRAHEIMLLTEGPVAYMQLTRNPALKGIKIIGLDDENLKKQTMRVVGNMMRALELLSTLTRAKSDFAAFHKKIEEVTAEKYGVISKKEKMELLAWFKNPAERKLVQEILDSLQEMVRLGEERSVIFAKKIAAEKGDVVTWMGKAHIGGTRRTLTANKNQKFKVISSHGAFIHAGPRGKRKTIERDGKSQKSAPKGSPARLLMTLRDNPELLVVACSDTGFTAKDITPHRQKIDGTSFSKTTVNKEIEVLKALGILVPAADRYHYRLSNGIRGPDSGFVKRLINAVIEIEHQVGEKGEKRPLYRYNIPKEKRPAVKKLVNKIIDDELLLELLIQEEGDLPSWIVNSLSMVYRSIDDEKQKAQLLNIIKEGFDYDLLMSQLEDLRAPPGDERYTEEFARAYRARELFSMAYDYSHGPAIFTKQVFLDAIVKLLNKRPSAIRLSDLSYDDLLALAPDREDNYEKLHITRTHKYALLIAKELGLRKELVEMIGRTAAVHDIGGLVGPIQVGDIEATIRRSTEVIKEYGLPTKSSPEKSLAALDALIKERPELAKYRLGDDKKFYLSMAYMIAGAYAADGAPITWDDLEKIAIEFSHERLGTDRLRQNGIILTPAEEFIINNHFFYPSDMMGIEEKAVAEGMTAEELKLLLDILIFCDIWENGNHATRLKLRRNIAYQPFVRTFELFGQFYGNTSEIGPEPEQAMMRLVAKKDPAVVALLKEQRPDDSTDAIKAGEYDEVAELLRVSERRNILNVPSEEILDISDGYVRDHIERVSKIALRMGREVGISDQEMNILRAAVYGHDAGPRHTPEDYAILEGYGVDFKKSKIMKREEFIKYAEAKKGSALTEAQFFVLDDIYRHGENFVEYLSRRYVVPQEVDLLIRHHKDSVEYVEKFGSMKNEISVPAERLRLLLEILITADMFENANSKLKMQMSGQGDVNSFMQSFEDPDVFSMLYQGKGITDMTARDILISLIVAEDEELLKVVFEGRGKKGLMPDDRVFIEGQRRRKSGRGKGSPADLLETIMDDPRLFDKVIGETGITVDGMTGVRGFSRGVVQEEFRILKKLGVLVTGHKSPFMRFNHTLRAMPLADLKYTINAIKEIEYQVGRTGDKRPLYRATIPKRDMVAVLEIVTREMGFRPERAEREGDKDTLERLRKVVRVREPSVRDTITSEEQIIEIINEAVVAHGSEIVRAGSIESIVSYRVHDHKYMENPLTIKMLRRAFLAVSTLKDDDGNHKFFGGSWVEARKRAGVTDLISMPPGYRGVWGWSEERVLDAIKAACTKHGEKAAAGGNVQKIKIGWKRRATGVDPLLKELKQAYQAVFNSRTKEPGYRLFDGEWSIAVRAAGFSYTTKKDLEVWSEASIIEVIKKAVDMHGESILLGVQGIHKKYSKDSIPAELSLLYRAWGASTYKNLGGRGTPSYFDGTWAGAVTAAGYDYYRINCPKGSGEYILRNIRDNEELLQKALMPKGIRVSAAPSFERGIRMLVSAGIFIPASVRGNYRLSPMMRGEDINYTKTMINALIDMGYNIKLEYEAPYVDSRLQWRRALRQKTLNKAQLKTIKQLAKTVVLEQIGYMQKAAIPEGKVLWHLIDKSILSEGQDYSFAQKINNASRSSGSPERIFIVDGRWPINEVIASIKEDCPNAVFDIALGDREKISEVPELQGVEQIRMLVFETSDGSDYTHLEAVVQALRALHLSKNRVIPHLLEILSVLKGSAYKGEVPDMSVLDDPREFARQFIFILPPVKGLPIDDIPKLNDHLLKVLIAA